MSEDGKDRLAYLKNGQVREEIAYAVGADPDRYGVDSRRGFKKADVIRVAVSLQPEDSDLEVEEMDLGGLYDAICSWAGGEYSPNAGKPWGLNRANLKAIHRAIDAQPPREVVSP